MAAALVYWGGSVALGVGCAALGYAAAGALWASRAGLRASVQAYLVSAARGQRAPSAATSGARAYPPKPRSLSAAEPLLYRTPPEETPRAGTDRALEPYGDELGARR